MCCERELFYLNSFSFGSFFVVKEGHQHGPDGVRGGVGERLLLRRPPHAGTQQISKAAVAGDAENINKQARKERTDWINKQKNNRQTASWRGARAA